MSTCTASCDYHYARHLKNFRRAMSKRKVKGCVSCVCVCDVYCHVVRCESRTLMFAAVGEEEEELRA